MEKGHTSPHRELVCCRREAKEATAANQLNLIGAQMLAQTPELHIANIVGI